MFLLVVRSCYAASIIDQSEVSIQEGSGLDSELEGMCSVCRAIEK